MESIFENSTEYSKKLYDEYIQFHAEKYGIKEIAMFIISAIAIIIMLVSAIIGIMSMNWNIAWILVLAVIILFYYWKIIKDTNKQYNNVASSNNTPKDNIAKYMFFERYFKTTYHGENDRVYYSEIRKIFELQDRYYMYMDNSHAFIILKNGFTKGSIEEFNTFIRKKRRFKVKKFFK